MQESASRRVLAPLTKLLFERQAQGRLFLAVSGGVDSMVLLEGIARLCRVPADRDRVCVVHVNHGLRGREADGDEFLVLARGRELGFEVRSFLLDWKNETPSQDRCRVRREAIFQELCANPSDRVVLAHHLNDQAETILFRLIRGTGARGLKGMLPASGVKLRPFLGLEKSTLLAAAQEWGVRWREDSSNRNTEAYERNWLRSIFPLIEKRRPGFQRKLAALAEEAASWKFVPEAPLDLFPYKKGVLFARPKGNPPAGVLSAAFGLGRTHSQELESLLQKSSGSLHTKQFRFTWSAGVLLAERGEGFRPKLETQHGRLSGSLGSWYAEELTLSAGGEKAKKEFQNLKVPVFFRSAVPLILVEGRATALLPSRLGRLPSPVSYQPSALAEWWLRPN